jgi:hypothetical protein
MSTLNAQSQLTGQIKNTISSVSGKLPNGQVPFKEGIARLKGILPNPITLQNVFKPGNNVPSNFLKDFDPTQDLVSNISISTVNIPEVEITPTEVPIEKPVDTEGLTEEQIQEEERKRELRQKRNEIASKIQNTIKDKAGGILGGLQGQANNLIQGAVLGATAGAITNSGLGEIALKIAAFKFFKAQIAESQKRVLNIQKEILKVSEEGKDVLKGATKSIVQDGKIKGESAQKEASAKSLEAQTNSMTPTYPSHPGPGNLANSSVTQAAKKAREEADGFKANMEQKAKNVGKFLKDGLEKIMNLISTILKVVGAILAIIAFIKFLKQLMELLMLLLFGKNNSTASAKENSKATSPEEFLAEIGYPGFTEQDFSQAIKDAFNNLGNSNIPNRDKFPQDNSLNTNNTTTNPNNSSTSNFNNSSINSQITEESGELNLSDPLIIGDTQIGNPITQSDLDPSSGKDFNNHPLLGDLTEIHPQITNELYNNGTLPLTNEPVLDPNSFSVDLDKLYDDIINELTETNQIEYIEKLYNLDFEMIGYKRYRA